TGLYALSNQTSAEDGSRKVVARRNETISFSTWELGTFTSGVECLSTGKLENTVLSLVSPEEITASALPAPAPRSSSPDAGAATNRSKIQGQMDGIFAGLSCASLTARVSADDRIAVFGYVASQQDWARLERDLQDIPQVSGVDMNLEIQPWPFCEAIAIIDRDWLSNELVLGRQRPNLPVIFPNKSDRRYRHGDRFIVWVRASLAIDGYLYVDLIDTDGTVTHLLPNSSNPVNWVAAGQTVAVGTDASRLFYTIEAPSGVNMILALSTTKPLFDNPRPEMESAEEYVSELRTQLRRLRSSGEKGEAFSSFIFIESYTPNIVSSAY
ncbi:MAG: DUF4384 domain-containing protein, partial [Proteobacteria bacterium]|nr:DUF4384 domain-containing protein [Pseudomonadota bacterium]